jgi:hypothetical protein
MKIMAACAMLTRISMVFFLEVVLRAILRIQVLMQN